MVKSIIATIVVAVALFGAIHASDLILGNYLPGDRILHSQAYFSPPIVNQIVNRTVSYNGVYNVTAVRAYDRSFNRTGLAFVHSGGIGQRNVSIMLQGYRAGVGYDYLVEIYGR